LRAADAEQGNESDQRADGERPATQERRERTAGAYLLEESIEEFSEGYAGFWVLNRLSRPVRIEADLIDSQTGQVLWREAHTGLAPWRWRHLRYVDDTTRDELLTTSMDKAVKALAASLDSRMRAEMPIEAAAPPEGL
jgi:hypothetical protein